MIYLLRSPSIIETNFGKSFVVTAVHILLSRLFPWIKRPKQANQKVDAMIRPTGKRPPSELITNI